MSRPPARDFQRRKSILSSKYIRGAIASRVEFLRRAGIEPAPALLDSISAYIELLLRWNAKINLTAITDPHEIVSRNFAESFLAARWLGSGAGRLCDVGSGAGFPGLALKLILPHWSVTLIESSRKKAAFLSEAARTLRLEHVEVECARWQESKMPAGSFDAITARALGGYELLADWAGSKLKPQGKLLLWIGASDAQRLRRLAGWQWQTQPVPDSRERVLLIGSRF
ncbi:MAG TPA: 16S rRNA (guanine(527)-N(7))-methyltransferase RsmG [Candidatus Acidoferrales bacterium]|nr:16S rRNA (guanine(527)-N(7))-methyltransferase RsmG [Candidatus Acidoferrales bacterium]